MNTESIIKQFELVESSIHRARLPFDTNMLQEPIIEVSLWEMMKAIQQLENMVREIAPERFGAITVAVTRIPELSVHQLHTCPYCGDPDCGSDHK